MENLDIVNLEGIQYVTHLTHIFLNGNPLESLEPLASSSFRNLYDIGFGSTESAFDLSPLVSKSNGFNLFITGPIPNVDLSAIPDLYPDISMSSNGLLLKDLDDFDFSLINGLSFGTIEFDNMDVNNQTAIDSIHSLTTVILSFSNLKIDAEIPLPKYMEDPDLHLELTNVDIADLSSITDTYFYSLSLSCTNDSCPMSYGDIKYFPSRSSAYVARGIEYPTLVKDLSDLCGDQLTMLDLTDVNCDIENLTPELFPNIENDISHLGLVNVGLTNVDFGKASFSPISKVLLDKNPIKNLDFLSDSTATDAILRVSLTDCGLSDVSFGDSFFTNNYNFVSLEMNELSDVWALGSSLLTSNQISLGYNYFDFQEGTDAVLKALNSQFPNASFDVTNQRACPCSSLPSLSAGEICWQYKPGQWTLDCSLGCFTDKSTNQCVCNSAVSNDVCIQCRANGKRCVSKNSSAYNVSCEAISGLSTGIIIAIVIGSIVVIGGIVTGIVFYVKSKKKHEELRDESKKSIRHEIQDLESTPLIHSDE
ncbi:hypothetical protein ADUPG1_006723 [Aduncisulcus paluster]|uniref:Uncharacterized protein n=1 Tax=Aduncisulcus paluster TaxID=2918883 RepID=A0ABQ5KJD1_9EUKA|nr:hypothetical protein ADUPG1_006723 [Aduncisulcus paluster]